MEDHNQISAAEAAREAPLLRDAPGGDPAFLRAVLENAHDAIVACNANGVLTLFNRSARELHGLPPEPIPAGEWPARYDLCHPDGTPMMPEDVPLFRAFQGETFRDVEMVIAPKNAPRRTLLASGEPLSDNRGNKFGAVVVMHDITERKRAAEQREALLRGQTVEILESIGDAFYAVDSDWRFTYVNRRAEEMWGIGRERLLGQNIWEAFPGSVGGRIQEKLLRAAEERRSEEFEMSSPVLSRWLSVSIFPNESGLSVYFRDVTGRKRAEEERESLLRQVEEGARQQRRFLRDVLASVTEGKLCLCESDEDLPPRFSPPFAEPVTLTTENLRLMRMQVLEAAREAGFDKDRAYDLVTGVGEAAMNAVRHAGGGTGTVGLSSSGTVQVWVEDHGGGIDMSRIPRATLERGFSSAGTLGHGFWMVLHTIDRIWLLTGPSGTTVVLEQDRTPREPSWMDAH